MWRMSLMCVITLIGCCSAQTDYITCRLHSTFRQADNSDITVTCGANYIYLSILLCPIYYGGYNESLVALNGRFNISACRGMADFGASTPVLNFNISIFQETMSLCGNSLVIVDQVDTGQLSAFSRVQFVNISGSVISQDPGSNPITYYQELQYQFSCPYPLQYLVNNTEVSVSRMSLAVRGNRGSFISTLSMNLFTNQEYTQPLQIPDGGLQLKTRIYVQVKANNLTNRFNVLLDRCYATTNPNPINSTYYDLFVGCNRDRQTVVDLNGVSQEARFSFEAFRFIEHQNKTVSTFYLHCITRLCENSMCSSMLPNCVKKVRRGIQVNQYSSETVSSGPIKTKVDSGKNYIETYAAHQNLGTFCLLLTFFLIMLDFHCYFLSK
ncbi:zona pellucida-like domain-containing protein 1 [Colossoma macropomum]|uniref:zona pellucida-like domain-containing protein 1 n=1 Tax=Colossoma macropomum TaxID=42526 RepID=UPI0018647836|nr:zona pellucida-like domain-containing protein 1 [Colossoma macropomum]